MTEMTTGRDQMVLDAGQDAEKVDVVVVGGGPAGLTATICAASEGLRTVLVDASPAGGAGASSSGIRSYAGTLREMSGGDLARLALVKIPMFGATVRAPATASGLASWAEDFALALSSGEVVVARTVICATGAANERLPLANWERLAETSIFFAVTHARAVEYVGRPVTVVGDGNAAGRAALLLAAQGSHVDLVVKGRGRPRAMNPELPIRLQTHPRVAVRTDAQIVELMGERRLEAVHIRRGASTERLESAALFCFIGATPASQWLPDVAVDANGFLLTDIGIDDDSLGIEWVQLGRSPFQYETSIPGLFAVGDVRSGSMRRIAGAAGEGARVVASVHALLDSQLAY